MAIHKIDQHPETFQLKGVAMVRFTINWLAILFIVIGVCVSPFLHTNTVGFQKNFMTVVPLILIAVGLRFSWPMVWKIELQNDGIKLFTLFQRRFVPIVNLKEVTKKKWGRETVYVLFFRDGTNARFSSGMSNQEQLLARLRQTLPDALLSGNKQVGSTSMMLFRQGFMLVWSVLAVLGGAAEIVIFTAKVLGGDHTAMPWIAHGLLFFLAGLTLGGFNILRAKSIRQTGRGVEVSTWLSSFETEWREIKSVIKLPIGDSLLVESKKGIFILGDEINHSDEVRKLILDNTQINKIDVTK